MFTQKVYGKSTDRISVSYKEIQTLMVRKRSIILSYEAPIERVSQMLGHKDLRTTQHYAKILDLKVSNDMKVLKEKFSTVKQAKAN